MAWLYATCLTAIVSSPTPSHDFPEYLTDCNFSFRHEVTLVTYRITEMVESKPWPQVPVGNKDHTDAAVVIIGAGISGMHSHW